MRIPFVTSHAACKGYAPENTLAGIRKAIELGADAIEVDIHCTKDGVPVLLHDSTVDRTTDGTGDIREMTLEEARRLDAGAKQHDGRYSGEPIPTLAEVLAEVAGRALLVLEIKQPGIEERVCRVVRDANAVQDCEVHSFWPQVVAAVRKAEPRMAAALLTDARAIKDWHDFFGFALSLNAQAISVHYRSAAPDIVRAAQRRGLSFLTWTVNEPADIRRVVDAGVDAVCSDVPDRVRIVVQGQLTLPA